MSQTNDQEITKFEGIDQVDEEPITFPFSFSLVTINAF